MSALTIDIADAVTDAINAGSFSQAVTAVRAYRPTYELEQLAALTTTVVPKGVTVTTAGRNRNQFDVTVDVAIQQGGIDPDDASTLDPLMELVTEIGDHFRLKPLTVPGIAGVHWVRSEHEPIFAPDHLREHRVFTGVLSLTFRAFK